MDPRYDFTGRVALDTDTDTDTASGTADEVGAAVLLGCTAPARASSPGPHSLWMVASPPTEQAAARRHAPPRRYI
ncbi:hypothetical protein [Streptomyces sp. NPDC055400]